MRTRWVWPDAIILAWEGPWRLVFGRWARECWVLGRTNYGGPGEHRATLWGPVVVG